MKQLLLLLIPFILIYTFSLGSVPVHLNQDELGFSLNAYSVAKTGLDENGRFLPLYFWHLGVMWATPIIVYLTSLFLLIFPLTEATIRLPSVLIGILNITLIFFVARKLFNSTKFGLLTAVFMGTIPVHFIQSRILLDNLFPVPFVLGWIYLLFSFFSSKKLWYLLLAGFILGLGVHSYHATKIMMPIYLILTLALLIGKLKEKRILAAFVVIIGFILPLLPLIPWLSKYPDTLTDQIRYTGLYNINLNPLQGIASIFKFEIITQRFLVYLKYFNPQFLFLTGDISLIHSTGKVGVFLLPFIVLLSLGIFLSLKNRNWFSILILIGFFTAPFAVALVGNEYRASKELFILPFACLLATYAIKFLFSSSYKFGKMFALILLIIIPIQFTFFLFDYFNDYRERSYVWFNYNIHGSLTGIINQDRNFPLSNIYLDNGVNFIDRYWKFYLIEYGKENLLSKTNYINPQTYNISNLPANSVLQFRFDHQPIIIPTNTKKVLEPDYFISFYVYRN